MFNEVYKNSSVPQDSLRASDNALRVVRGYILQIVSLGEDRYYKVLVALEGARAGQAVKNARVVTIEEPGEHLAATFGEPEDLIGRRVRIEYTGGNWWRGVARVIPQQNEALGESLDLPSRGFRYAVAGGGSI
jgi:hypothetical protein